MTERLSFSDRCEKQPSLSKPGETSCLAGRESVFIRHERRNRVMKFRNLLPKRRRRRRKNRKPCRGCSSRCERVSRVETLEQRQLLTGSNLFSQFRGILDPALDDIVQHVEVDVGPEALSTRQDKVILGFRASAYT